MASSDVVTVVSESIMLFRDMISCIIFRCMHYIDSEVLHWFRDGYRLSSWGDTKISPITIENSIRQIIKIIDLKRSNRLSFMIIIYYNIQLTRIFKNGFKVPSKSLVVL